MSTTTKPNATDKDIKTPAQSNTTPALGTMTVAATDLVVGTPEHEGIVKARIQAALEDSKNGRFSLKPEAFIDSDAANLAARTVMNAIANGTPARDIVRMPENKYLDMLSVQLGIGDSKVAIRQNTSNEALRSHYAPVLEDAELEFNAIVSDFATTNRESAEKGLATSAKTFVLTTSGQVVDEDFFSDGDAAKEFMTLKKASVTSQINVCGVKFAVVYKNGATKAVNFAR